MPVWGAWESGERFEIVWPAGFQLSTTSPPVVLDPHGVVIARDGDLIDDAVGSGGEPVTICGIGGRTYDLNP